MPKTSPSLTSPSLTSPPRLPRLLTALEARLEALTTGLEQVDVTGKGLDLIKEIKELHAILDNLRQDTADKSPPTLTIIWGDAHASSSQTSPPRGTGNRSATPKGTPGKPPRKPIGKPAATATDTAAAAGTPTVHKHA